MCEGNSLTMFVGNFNLVSVRSVF